MMIIGFVFIFLDICYYLIYYKFVVVDIFVVSDNLVYYVDVICYNV